MLTKAARLETKQCFDDRLAANRTSTFNRLGLPRVDMRFDVHSDVKLTDSD